MSIKIDLLRQAGTVKAKKRLDTGKYNILTVTELMQLVAKTLGKPCIFLSFQMITDDSNFGDIIKAAPYLKWDVHGQHILDGVAVIVCEDYDEMQRLYWMTVGDDGPTKTNKYDGKKARVYALTCNAEGGLENENT
jgi:hypothetical protein